MPNPDEWAHKLLLHNLNSKTLSGEKVIAVSQDVETLHTQLAVERAERSKQFPTVEDPRVDPENKVDGVFSGLVERDTRLRYRRAPEVLDPLDVQLPEEDWKHSLEIAPEAERLRLAKEAISRSFKVESYTTHDTLPHRIRVAWRLTREIARLKGLVAEDETLAEGLSPTRASRDPWVVPAALKLPLQGRAAQNAVAGAAVKILQKIETLPEMELPCVFPMPHSDEKLQLLGARSVGLVPPAVPWRFRDPDTHLVCDEYDEQDDRALKLFVELVESIARYLQIERGAEDDPDLGRLGLIGLVNANTVRALWPSRLQIVYWEEQLIQATLEQLTDSSVTTTKRWLSKAHGLTASEASSVIKMSMTLARQQTEVDVEDQRAIMILRLEEFANRARTCLDLRAELAAFKQLSIVQGLSRTDPEDTLTVFANIVKKMDVVDAAARPTIDATARLGG